MTTRPEYYILNADGDPWTVDLLTWTQWFESSRDQRILAREEFPGDVCVSTVFLGMDHNLMGDGPPVLWESLVFGTTLDGEMRRYTSRTDALRGHADLVAQVRQALGT